MKLIEEGVSKRTFFQISNIMDYKFRINSLISKLFASGIALLGFGCSSTDPDLPIRAMYGCPTGKFTIKGKVSTEDGKSVNDATLRVVPPPVPSFLWTITEGKSNEEGLFTLVGEDAPLEQVKVVCIPADKSLASDSTIVKIEYVDKTGSTHSWYYGEGEATVDFILKKKDNSQ